MLDDNVVLRKKNSNQLMKSGAGRIIYIMRGTQGSFIELRQNSQGVALAVKTHFIYLLTVSNLL